MLAVLLITAYAATAIAWSIATPIFEAPDELGHIEYVARLVLQKTLPEQNIAQRNYAHHPPLYYAVAALVSAGADWRDERDMPDWRGSGHGAARARHSAAERFPWRGRVAAVHIARFTSIAFGATAVAFVIAAGRLAFPGKPAIGLTAGALLAWTPQFTFITSAVNNDAAAAAAGAVVLWALLRARRQPGDRRRWLLVGAACGAALLTKATALSLVGATAVLWGIEGVRRSDRRAWLSDGATLFGGMAAICGWWFVRNIALYGDPFGWTVYRQAWSSMMRTAPPSVSELAEIVDIAWRSYWGWFGWLTLDAGDWLHIAANVLVGAAVWGAWAQRGFFLRNAHGMPGSSCARESSGCIWRISSGRTSCRPR
jgi:hypothetical protein